MRLSNKLTQLVVLLLLATAVVSVGIIKPAAGARANKKVSSLNPVVLIPGVSGSQIEVKLNASYKAPHWYCAHGRSDAQWRRVWFAISDYFLPSCLADEMHVTVENNPSTESGLFYRNTLGAEVRAVDFGGVEGIKNLDPTFPTISSYFEPIIEVLQGKGYVIGETLFGAPYDFRYAGDGLAQNGFEKNLTDLIETAVNFNRGKRMVLVAHSMGGMVVTHFLAGMPKEWTSKYIEQFVSISSPYGGAVGALEGTVSGQNVAGLPDPAAFLPIQDNTPASAWLFPASGLWGLNDTMIRTGSYNYTASPLDFVRLLERLGRYELLKALPTVRNLRGIHFDADFGPEYPPLHVDKVTCFHGSGVPTAKEYIYSDDHFLPGEKPRQPIISKYGDGDGIVEMRSLEYCESIPGSRLVTIAGQEHIGILSSKDLQEQLVQTIFDGA